MKEIPVTVKRSLELLGLFLIGVIIVIGKVIIMPLLMSFFISIMLLPAFRFFRKRKLPESIAILIPISRVFGFSPTDQLNFINQQSSKLFNYAANILSGAAGSATGVLIFFGLLPIYTFLLMMYRSIFMKFILMCFEPKE